MIPDKSSPKQYRENEQIVLHGENMNERRKRDKGGLGRCQELIAHNGSLSWIAVALPSALTYVCPVEPSFSLYIHRGA
jgi:hypothetical protein